MIDILTASRKIRSSLFFILALFSEVCKCKEDTYVCPLNRDITLPKFIELCMETPCLCPSEGHKYGAVKSPKHLSLSFAIEAKNNCSRDPLH